MSVASEVQTLVLTAPDGVPISCRGWTAVTEPRGIVQITHGVGEHAERYDYLARRLNRAGYLVYAQDHRGHGATATSRQALGVLGPDGWRKLVGDIDLLRRHATRQHPDIPWVLLGHSMGSFAVQQYLLDNSADAHAAVLTGTTVLDVIEPLLDLDAPSDLSILNAPFEPGRTPFDWLTRDEAQVDAYIADPRCGFGIDVDSNRAMYVAARALADPDRLAAMRLDLPICIIAGEDDPAHGQMTLIDALAGRYRTAGLTDVTVHSYPGARHEVFNEINRDEVIDDLIGWLAGR